MPTPPWTIEPDIRQAATPPAEVYSDPRWFHLSREQIFPWSNLQLGVASGGGDVFNNLPPGHPDAGRGIAAWYFWFFPNTMLNVYPWGISLNLVRPRLLGRFLEEGI